MNLHREGSLTDGSSYVSRSVDQLLFSTVGSAPSHCVRRVLTENRCAVCWNLTCYCHLNCSQKKNAIMHHIVLLIQQNLRQELQLVKVNIKAPSSLLSSYLVRRPSRSSRYPSIPPRSASLHHSWRSALHLLLTPEHRNGLFIQRNL